MRRLAGIAAVVSTLLVVAGCGGGNSNDESSDSVEAPEWATPLILEKGPEGAAIMASSDFAKGSNRVSFLLVRNNGALVSAPVADVYYQPRESGPTRKAVARLVPIGTAASGADTEEVKEIYVATLEFPKAGKHWVVMQPRGTKFQGYQILDVKDAPTAVAIGDRAPASNNPTLATQPAKKITTARPPDTELLRYSVADSLKARAPFVVTFATPTFCESRTCGPTVDVVDATRKRFKGTGVRFIHVEIYEDNLPGNGVNRWVKEWNLPTEPWVYVVDRRGIVRDRFEGAVSVGELERSIRTNLLDG